MSEFFPYNEVKPVWLPALFCVSLEKENHNHTGMKRHLNNAWQNFHF